MNNPVGIHVGSFERFFAGALRGLCDFAHDHTIIQPNDPDASQVSKHFGPEFERHMKRKHNSLFRANMYS